MCQRKLSMTDAVESLREFLTAHLPDGTDIDVTMEALDDMVGTANNLVAMATEQGVNVDVPRQAYEAAGWLSVMLETWLFDSPYHDGVFAAWAESLGVN